MKEKQAKRGLTNHVLMIRPEHFGFNIETSKNNVFQKMAKIAESVITTTAIQEFDAFVIELRKAGIEVTVWQDDGMQVRPDAIFPNNWISFHEDGTIVTYPMYAENRRLERDDNLVSFMREEYGLNSKIEFEDFENEDKYLEGTGSMVLDRENKICYACLSPRTHFEVLKKWCTLMDYRCMKFSAVDKNGTEIYHTNVMMALGQDLVVICKESIQDKREWEKLKKCFEETNKQILEIDHVQLEDYAGNMLFVVNENGQDVVIVSLRAWDSLNHLQRNVLKLHYKVVKGAISTIESIGGGSVRCMLAEVFSPSEV